MKKIFVFTVLILSLLLLLPLTALKGVKTVAPTISPAEKIPTENDHFKILNTSTDEVFEVSVKDYIFGVVSAEMPALYEEEALKAQAVAAYTFAIYRQAENSDKNYDLTDDYLSDQSYISKSDAQKRWGSNADIYTQKIESAIDEVKDLVITYDGQPILSVYHAISSGLTEDAENVWGKPYPYLIPVESIGDKLCENYTTTLTVNEDKLRETLKDEVEFSGEPENYFKEISRTESGTVKTIKVCNKELNGSRIRSLFLLRSSNFTVKYSEGKFTFTVCGYGHAVGMSQNGADYMAKQGSSFEEILTHYYTDCKIEKYD